MEEELDWRSQSNEDAVVYFMKLYGEEIKRLTFSFVKNWEQAEDITQDVFVTLYTKLDTFRGEAAVRSWIYTIAINRSKDFLRSWHHRKIAFTDKWLPLTAASPTTVEEDVMIQSDNKMLARSVLELPIKYREVVILYYYNQFSLKEISEMTGIGEGTLKTRLIRGRNKLQDIYCRNGGRD
ncbi:sigma-70 family RNA polymerase sigma factor [Fictibacillus iocasae]|uniref:Sigma-70 family RNA polymerase sigma factor n=1 Tax=Fictibacillus iocasae TaxID=2715437 RepID=A0ABW2NQ35_9BACL